MYSSNVLKNVSLLTGISSPATAKEIRPVSSLTTTVTESVISEIPIAARWREPYLPVRGFVVGV